MSSAIPNHLRPRREKIFGPAPGIPLDRNAKVADHDLRAGLQRPAPAARPAPRPVLAAARIRAFMEVLEALLWGFQNGKDGRCFPSYESIAARARCSRDTVYEAIKALEFANILTWVNRITRISVRSRDLFGQWATRWQIIRTSNAYLFRDPLPCHEGRPSLRFARKSENPSGTINPDFSLTYSTAPEAEPEAVTAAREALARVRHQREAILLAGT